MIVYCSELQLRNRCVTLKTEHVYFWFYISMFRESAVVKLSKTYIVRFVPKLTDWEKLKKPPGCGPFVHKGLGSWKMLFVAMFWL